MNRMFSTSKLSYSLCLLLSTTLCVRAVPSFTVSPASTSNSYSGFVLLQATGLFTNETIVVRKYVDGNTNGIVDAPDFFIQQFTVTDQGAASKIGGATNVNIPYDTNSTQGSISVSLSMLTQGLTHRLAAKYLYVFSSPSNHFTPVTNTFTLTNAAFAQTISGNVLSNATPVPYATVLVGYASGNGFNPFTGTIANSTGAYSVKIPTGTFQALAFKTNFIGVPVGPFAVGTSSNLVTNLTMIAASNYVSGRFSDATNSSIPLVGMLAISQGNGIGVSSTDTNGNYTVPVITNSNWKINAESTSFDFIGYVNSNSSPRVLVTSNITGFNLSYPRAEAMIYGRVLDNNNNPVSGVRLYGQNGDFGNGSFEGDATSDSNGNYSMGLVAGNWDAEIDLGASPPQFSNYIFSVATYSYNNGSNGLTLSAGQAVRQDFLALIATNTISGYLRDGNNNPIAGVQVNAFVSVNGTNFNAQAITDSTGFYSFNAANGTWYVFVNCCNGSCDNGLPAIYQCPNFQQTTVANNNQTVNFTAQRATLLSGKVTDNLGNPVPNINIFAYPDGGGFAGAQTDGSGNYSLGLSGGGYSIQLDNGPSGISSYGLIGPNLHVMITSGVDVTNYNVVCRQITGTITASITNTSSSSPVSGIGISGSATLQGTNYSTDNPSTDANGKVTLSVCNGTWTVSPDCNALGLQSLSCPGTTNVNVANNNPSVNMTVQQCGLQIMTTNLPSGTVGVSYDNFLNGNGCYPPFSWFQIGGTLPQGLFLGSNGELSGTPTTAGTNTFTVEMDDNNFNSTTTNVTIIINPGATPLQVTTASLPNALNGGFYNTSLSATGGTPPYSWSIDNGSQNPPSGIVLGTNGILSGTCTAGANTYFFYVLVTDSTFNSANRLLSITVTNAPLQITTTNLPNGNLGVYYSNTLAAVGGQQPYSWSLAPGSAALPAGLTLSGSGAVFGTPTATGTFVFRPQVNDSGSAQTNRLVQLIINPMPTLAQPFRVNPSQFQFHLKGSIGQNYTLQYSTPLTTGSWTSFAVTNPTSGDVIILDPTATNLLRGYRALIGP